MSRTREYLLAGVTSAPETGNSFIVDETSRAYQATVTGTGAVTATVVIEGSNNASNWLELGTITLSGTGSDTDGFGSIVPWLYVRSRLTAITGTGATVNVIMGA